MLIHKISKRSKSSVFYIKWQMILQQIYLLVHETSLKKYITLLLTFNLLIHSICWLILLVNNSSSRNLSCLFAAVSADLNIGTGPRSTVVSVTSVRSEWQCSPPCCQSAPTPPSPPLTHPSPAPTWLPVWSCAWAWSPPTPAPSCAWSPGPCCLCLTWSTVSGPTLSSALSHSSAGTVSSSWSASPSSAR